MGMINQILWENGQDSSGGFRTRTVVWFVIFVVACFVFARCGVSASDIPTDEPIYR